MLEWMRDPGIADMFQADFAALREGDALAFIESSWDDDASLHFAIADENDGYLGTVSLKNVDLANGSAEYAISTRRCAHGTGAAMAATRDVLDYAFDELGLHRVYLNVRADNLRAIRFYEKAGFVREGVARGALRLKREAGSPFVDLVWFAMLETERPQAPSA